MINSFSFSRLFFVAVSTAFLAAYLPPLLSGGINAQNLAYGAILGAAFGIIVLSVEKLLRACHLKSFFVAAIGLFFGCMLGNGIFSLIAPMPVEKEILGLVHGVILLFCGYSGFVIANRSSDEIAFSIPYVRLKASGEKRKDLLIDLSVLADSRILDLASSGLVDGQLLLPRFIVKELQTLGDDLKAKKSLETIKKLETIPSLGMKPIDTDFPEIKELSSKLIKLARSLDANLLTADISRVQQAEIQGVRIINIHLLSNALKPITQSGEQLDIKVQRFGKEARQGVGYLEDGTMVVVNGGADFIGQTIRCNVLSVKHTGSGRLIFCNAPDEETLSQDSLRESLDRLENPPSNYFVSDYERHRV